VSQHAAASPSLAVPAAAPARSTVATALGWLARVGTVLLGVLLVVQVLRSFGVVAVGFDSWRPVALALVVWFVLVDAAVVVTRGQRGQQLLFLLPGLQVTLALVVFPTLFGFVVAFAEWDLGSVYGLRFNGFDNFRKLAGDETFWNALGNNVQYVLVAIPIQYVIAFGVALLLNQPVRGRKFFRVAFLLPFMISPVAVGWMIGRSIMDANRGVLPNLLENVGLRNVSFFDQGVPAFLGIVAMDSWINIPFMMVMLLAGLQALPTEIFEAAQIDGASGWRRFRDITFPLMLPVSLTAIVLRMIFEFKLVDIVRVVTAGGPGGATDTVSLYIYREGVESTNVGYATTMAMVFLVIVLVTVSLFIVLVARRVRDVTY
jgi:multiple sugar transport system permease protein